MKQPWRFSIWSLLIIVATTFDVPLCRATGIAGHVPELLVTKECRKTLAYTDAGEITAVDVNDGRKDVGSYHLEFFTIDARSLLLPILLHTNMLLYVHTGRGTVNWLVKKRVVAVEVEPGDIYKLEQGTVFYIESSADPTREKLRIHAIFDTVVVDDENTGLDFVEVFYSNVSDLVRGFDVEVLQMGLGVSPEVIQEIKSAVKPPPIIPSVAKNGTDSRNMDWREGILDAVFGKKALQVLDSKKKEKKVFNIIKRKPDVKNSHGRSTAVTCKDAKSLKGSSMGLFMVNLTRSSMMGPHWNPKATEIAIVVRGRGMVQVVSPCKPSGLGDDERSTMRFYVKEGDVFVVPRFHPMAQMSFENESFVFVGFSSNAGKNHPQFLAGRWSVLRTLEREILAAAFNVTVATMDKLVAAQEQAVLLGCVGCAEEERKKLEMEMEKKKHEEESKREEERKKEERKREEEEEREKEEKRREEERKRREEREREEEERKRQEERKREEEERERKEEEERKREEEEERKREEEERERQEERKREEEERERKEEEERKREEEEREEEERERKEEEERKREEEEERKREEEERERQEERKREEEERERKEEEERKREEEEERKREEEERERKEEEERKREEEEERKREEEEREKKDERKRQEEEEERKRVEEERKRHEEEESRKREEEERERKEGAKRLEEEVKRQEEERKREEEMEKKEEKSNEKEGRKKREEEEYRREEAGRKKEEHQREGEERRRNKQEKEDTKIKQFSEKQEKQESQSRAKKEKKFRKGKEEVEEKIQERKEAQKRTEENKETQREGTLHDQQDVQRRMEGSSRKKRGWESSKVTREKGKQKEISEQRR
ncbi:hypothetical protein HPP92_020964 [Vanilla planifolia]|uniref:Cupin type-1 domain-containing protein n=1 Tax=Vanilla planifolia TaxID=51239 RepID=A0A835UIC1_VANPL|nr:hypothetical protein HPP92_020964 [Vanilla planifolia]